MVEKINSWVCDQCRICCGKGVDGYPFDNGWTKVYSKKNKVLHYCPACAEKRKLAETVREGE